METQNLYILCCWFAFEPSRTQQYKANEAINGEDGDHHSCLFLTLVLGSVESLHCHWLCWRETETIFCAFCDPKAFVFPITGIDSCRKTQRPSFHWGEDEDPQILIVAKRMETLKMSFSGRGRRPSNCVGWEEHGDPQYSIVGETLEMSFFRERTETLELRLLRRGWRPSKCVVGESKEIQVSTAIPKTLDMLGFAEERSETLVTCFLGREWRQSIRASCASCDPETGITAADRGWRPSFAPFVVQS